MLYKLNNPSNLTQEQFGKTHHNNQMQNVMKCNKEFTELVKSYKDIELEYRQLAKILEC